MFNSLGYQTDALVMKGRSTFEDRGSFVVQRTPAEQEFWFGNQLIFREFQPLEQMTKLFQAEFPSVSHMVLGFDVLGQSRPGWNLAGLELDEVDVLALSGRAADRPLPEGLIIREIKDADWEQVVALQHTVGVEQGYPAKSHLKFIQSRFRAVATQCCNDTFAWFGAFDAGLLVADMGITWSETIARYQNVETRQSHRGKGICAALLSHTSAFVADLVPNARQVIVAEVDSPAGRIYRRSGFEHVESLVSIVRQGY